jgi:hypothetical protein
VIEHSAPVVIRDLAQSEKKVGPVIGADFPEQAERSRPAYFPSPPRGRADREMGIAVKPQNRAGKGLG